jgi:hypothetical protein
MKRFTRKPIKSVLFYFIETSVLAWSYTYVYLLYTVVLLVAYLSKNILLINQLLIINALPSMVKPILPLILRYLLLTILQETSVNFTEIENFFQG